MGVAVGCNTPPLRATPEGRGGRSRTWRRCDEGDPSTEGKGVGEEGRGQGRRKALRVTPRVAREGRHRGNPIPHAHAGGRADPHETHPPMTLAPDPITPEGQYP